MTVEKTVCQSCGMPLDKDEYKGTNTDGTKSQKYCVYCFKNGEFTENLTVDEMIEHNLEFLDGWNKDAGTSFTVDEAREQLKAYLPMLERWK